MKNTFFIVGPTASGKSELAADVAKMIGAEIVSADAFQIYRGFDVLSGKPDAATLVKVRHHLLDPVLPAEEMNAERFRSAANRAIADIQSREKLALVVGGSGLYLKALTHGLSEMPETNPDLRKELGGLRIDELQTRLIALDPDAAARIDLKNRRRVVRALEICLITGKPASEQRSLWNPVAGVGDPGLLSTTAATGLRPGSPTPATIEGVFVFRNRDELYERINHRVEAMLRNGAIDEVRNSRAVGSTAAKMIGFREIRNHLDGQSSIAECMAAIQQATRQYAKRQLTWFRRQTNFEPLNLSLLSCHEAVEWVSRRAIAGRAEG